VTGGMRYRASPSHSNETTMSAQPSSDELIYDWNEVDATSRQSMQLVEFDDETLRDGLQSPSVVAPTLEEQLQILHLMDSLGIHAADIGLPGAGPRTKESVRRLAQEIAENGLNVAPNCAARTLRVDIDPIISIAQDTGIPIEVSCFIGSSPIRQYAEEWNIDLLLRHTEEAVSYAVKAGLPVMYVTEDTTRAHPDAIRRLYTTAIECGARRICVCDTVGHIIPTGVVALLHFVREIIKETGESVQIDWHGHRDRGLSIPNTLAAIEAGANRVHATILGIGERVGNTPLDLLMVNLKLLGVLEHDLSRLPEYCQLVSDVCEVPIPVNYPVFGQDAFRTGTGVHAAAVIKAKKKGDAWLANRVYSGVPAELFGLRQSIEIGPMSGESNVFYWLEERGVDPDAGLAELIFQAAKDSDRVLREQEVWDIVTAFLEEKETAP